MSNNNHQNPTCTFAESLVSYLYGEISDANKVEFEIHLESCANCHNELVQFGFARSAVQEWRSVEFEKLATPVFDVPTGNSKSPTAARPLSWFAEFSELFKFKPAMAMAAFAVAVGLFGFAVFMFDFKGEGEIAKKSDDQNMIQPDISPTLEKKGEQSETNIGKDEDKIVEPTKINNKNQVKLKTTANKDKLTTPGKYPAGVVTIRTVENTRKGNPKPNALPKTKVPRLSDEEETEDNSVRLADLFDEIETR